jgi:ABC-2 type transport system permease protein
MAALTPSATTREQHPGRLAELALRYWGIAATSVKEKLIYRFDFFSSLVSAMLTATLLYFLWRAIYQSATNLGLPLQALLTYVVLGQVFNFSSIGAAQRRVMWDVVGNIQTGNIIFDLVRPADYQAMQLAASCGTFVSGLLLTSLPAYLLALVVFGISVPASPAAGVGFAASLLAAFLLSFSLDFFINILAFWTFSLQGIMYAKKALLDVLAGTIIPISLFPGWLHTIAQVLPFQGLAYTPLAIYTGAIAGTAIWRAIAVQLLWALALVVLTRLVWLRALRRLVIQGG